MLAAIHAPRDEQGDWTDDALVGATLWADTTICLRAFVVGIAEAGKKS